VARCLSSRVETRLAALLLLEDHWGDAVPRGTPKHLPFRLTTSPAAYVPRADTERALDFMRRWALASKSAVLVLSGPPGIGKTLLLKTLAARLDVRRTCVYIPYPDLSARGLSRWILQSLGRSGGNDPTAALAREVEMLRRQGAELLLLIDDAPQLPAETAWTLAEWVRSEGSVLRLVLVTGEKYTEAGPVQTLGRGAARVALEALLSPVEAATLVRAELDRARVGREIQARFDAVALSSLYEASGGVPARLLQEASQYLPRFEDFGLAPVGRLSAIATESPESASAPAPAPIPDLPPRSAARLRIPTPAVWAALGVTASIAIAAGVDVLRGSPAPRANRPPGELPPVAAPAPPPPPLPRAPAAAVTADEATREAPVRAAAVRAGPSAVAETAPPPPPAPRPEQIALEGAIAPGSWLAAELREHGVPAAVSALIARELEPLFDFRRSRPGQRFRLVRDADGRLLVFDYIIKPGESVHLRREGEGYAASRGDGAFAIDAATRSRESSPRDR
jgi:type II secretory pathway predicted ATPase ExeA